MQTFLAVSYSEYFSFKVLFGEPCYFTAKLHSYNTHSVFTRLQTTGPNHRLTGLPESHSSPDTQTVGSLHRLAVSQQKAAVASEPLQQSLRGITSNSPIVNGPDQNPLPLHVASLTLVGRCERATDCRSRWMWLRSRSRKSFLSGFHTSDTQHHYLHLCIRDTFYSAENWQSNLFLKKPHSSHFRDIVCSSLFSTRTLTWVYINHQLTHIHTLKVFIQTLPKQVQTERINVQEFSLYNALFFQCKLEVTYKSVTSSPWPWTLLPSTFGDLGNHER